MGEVDRTEDDPARGDDVDVPARSTGQVRTGRVGWILWVTLLLATAWQVMIAFGFLASGAFGGGLAEGEVAAWVATARVVLVASVVCCVLGVIAERWVLVSLSVLLTLIAIAMNIVQWKAGGSS